MRNPKQHLALWLSEARIFDRAHILWEQNQRDWHLPLSKLDKLLVGSRLILHDYARGEFPPSFQDQQQAYEAEIAYKYSLPGLDVREVTDGLMRKPFWFGPSLKSYLMSFIDLASALERVGIHPPQKLLELGCGTGWMAEFLALMNFDVLGTSISHHEIEDARARVESVRAKKLAGVKLNFRVAPMETIDQEVTDQVPFDGVYVFEALHHAYDWRQAVHASYHCLKPGGWLVIANEPNVLHTFVSYRVAKLSNTHEIGFSRRELMQQLQRTGFRNLTVLKNRVATFIRPHWIAAQR
jgi:2-polyprenyl-3-methyl-5-hydroxy-6-metoxy-1,4-benzoquinol methylase